MCVYIFIYYSDQFYSNFSIEVTFQCIGFFFSNKIKRTQLTFILTFSLPGNQKLKKRNLTRTRSSSKARKRRRVFCLRPRSVKSEQSLFWSRRGTRRPRRRNQEPTEGEPRRNMTRKPNRSDRPTAPWILSPAWPKRARRVPTRSRPNRANCRRRLLPHRRRKRRTNQRKNKEVQKSKVYSAI